MFGQMVNMRQCFYHPARQTPCFSGEVEAHGSYRNYTQFQSPVNYATQDTQSPPQTGGRPVSSVIFPTLKAVNQ